MHRSREFRALAATPPDHHRASGPLRIVADAFGDEPGMDTAASLALLRGASSGSVPETLRLYTPGPIVAFGKRDVMSAGYRRAVAAARERDFAAVERLAGGRAAVFHPGTVAFGWTIPDSDPQSRIGERFATMAGIVAAALRRLGVDARIGEVPGEYCPGRYSVSAGGAKKLMGVGQRLARRAAHVGGVIVVAGADRVRDVLMPVYGALGIRWDPETVGAVEDDTGPIAVAAVKAALLEEFGRQRRLTFGTFEAREVAAARRLARAHVATE